MPIDLLAEDSQQNAPVDLLSTESNEQSPPSSNYQNESWPMQLADLINTGRGQFIQGLKNFPHNALRAIETHSDTLSRLEKEGKYKSIADYLSYDKRNISAENGTENAGLLGRMFAGAMHYGPYAATPAPELKAIENFGPRMGGAIQFLQNKILNTPILGKAVKAGISQVPGGALYGATQSQDPLGGAAESALMNLVGGTALNPVGRGLGLMFGTKASKQDLANGILRYARNRHAELGANSPELAGEALQKNWTDEKGNPLPIDLGNLINSPSLNLLYNVAKYSPFSGGIKNRNIIRESLVNRAVNEAEGEHKALKENAPIAPTPIPAPEEKQFTPTHAQNMDAELGRQMQALQEQKGATNQAVESTTPLVNRLVDAITDKSNIVGHVKEEATNNYKAQKQNSDALYKPINDSKIQLDRLGDENRYPNYRSEAVDLLAQRDNLKNLFGSDSDLSARLHGEINKAESLVNNKGEYAESLPDVVKRIKSLRRLQSAAYKAGSYNEARLLGRLGDSLHNDTLSLLENSGHKDLSNILKTADTNYKNNLVPYYADQTIRKMVTEDKIPAPLTLAKAIHNPNNERVFTNLSPAAKNAALNLRLTEGKLSPTGSTSLTPQQLNTKYSNLDQATRNAIQSHNPEVSQHFENLGANLEHQKYLSNKEAAIQKEQQTNQKMQEDTRKTNEKLASDTKKENEKLAKAVNDLNKKANEKHEKEKANYAERVQKSLERLNEAHEYRRNAPRDSLAHKLSAPTTLSSLALAESLRFPSTWKLLAGTAAASPMAKSLQEILTSPELRNAYINGSDINVNRTLGAELSKRFAPLAVTPQFTGNQ